MKKKYLTQKELQNKFESGENLEFGINPPFSSIAGYLQKNTLFFAWHWDVSIAMAGATGTAYACRIGDFPCRFDFDVLSLRLNKKGVPEIFHVYTDYHHANEIPQFMKNQMPQYIKNKVEIYLKAENLKIKVDNV